MHTKYSIPNHVSMNLMWKIEEKNLIHHMAFMVISALSEDEMKNESPQEILTDFSAPINISVLYFLNSFHENNIRGQHNK